MILNFRKYVEMFTNVQGSMKDVLEVSMETVGLRWMRLLLSGKVFTIEVMILNSKILSCFT